MLAGTNDYILARKGLGENIIFFYQRWRELLASKTQDMCRYNILNVCVAFDELESVISKTLSGLLISRKNFDDCLAETLEILKNDDILAIYNKPLRIRLYQVITDKKNLKKFASSENIDSSFVIGLRKMGYQLKTPCAELRSNYLNYILDELKKDVNLVDKRRMSSHMSMLISQCLFEGWSTQGLEATTDLFEGTNTLEVKWEMFRQRLTVNRDRAYRIFYSIKIAPRQGITVSDIVETIHNLNIAMKRGSALLEDPEYSTSNLNAELHYAIVDVTATDPFSAVLNAINSLNNKLSVATFYNVINPWIASSPQLVIFDITNNTFFPLNISDVIKTYDYIDSANSVFEDTKNILMNSTSEIVNRLTAAFSYTNLSRTAIFQETKFISLWIALESVMRTGLHTDIISHIKMVLPEVLCIRYFYRIIRNFSEDCIRCGIKSITDISINMESIDKKQLAADLIRAFRNSAEYQVILNKCEEKNQLLGYRCNEIHDMICDCTMIIARLESHKQKIQWHIQRLYRIRNEITHSAFNNDKSLTIYIEHLYTYLSQFISEVVYYIEHKGNGSIEHACCNIVDIFNAFIELMHCETYNICDILKNGIIEI